MADEEFLTAVNAFEQSHHDLSPVDLASGNWIPATAVEFAAALRMLALDVQIHDRTLDALEARMEEKDEEVMPEDEPAS
jgi:hypothetical protein